MHDGLEFFNLIERNRDRLRDYFSVTSATITTLTACFNFLDEKIKEAGEKERYTFVIEDENNQLRGLYFIKT